MSEAGFERVCKNGHKGMFYKRADGHVLCRGCKRASANRYARRKTLERKIERDRLNPPHLIQGKKFWAKVKKTENCWMWLGALNEDGYGICWYDGKGAKAYRVSYTEIKGPIPEGLEIDHLCRNRSCVNPEHLEAVTKRENILRGEGASAKNARKTHCVRGHKFTNESVYISHRGHRSCKACACIRARIRQKILPNYRELKNTYNRQRYSLKRGLL